MKYKEIENLTIEEINNKISEELGALKKLKFSHAISPIDNPLRIKNTRRLIARLYTALKFKSNDVTDIKINDNSK